MCHAMLCCSRISFALLYHAIPYSTITSTPTLSLTHLSYAPFQVTNRYARNLISMLLSKDPSRRPSPSRVLDHPFLSNKRYGTLYFLRDKYYYMCLYVTVCYFIWLCVGVCGCVLETKYDTVACKIKVTIHWVLLYSGIRYNRHFKILLATAITLKVVFISYNSLISLLP
jgi:hypothetical protein